MENINSELISLVMLNLLSITGFISFLRRL